MATTNYAWNLPTVGGSESTWGTQLNSNWTALDTLLGGTNATEFAILDGATVTTAELNILDGVTATTAEINILAGTTVSATELNYLTGVTSNLQSQIDNLSIIPSGAIQAFARNTAPTDWLAADGSAVSRTTYAALFAAIGTTFGSGDGGTTFNVPDLRGEFIRGWDNGRGIDSGRSFGSAQDDELEAHTHFSGLYGPRGASGDAVTFATTDSGYPAINTGSTGGGETRPRNIALLYCIKT